MKKGRVFVIAFLISFVVVSIVIAVEMSFRKKALEEDFLKNGAGRSLERTTDGYDCFFQNEDYIKELESLKGGSLSEEERKEQFGYYLTNISEYNNAGSFSMVDHKEPIIGGSVLIFDPDMKLLNTEDVLFLVKDKSENDKIIRYYYVFRNYDLGQEIDKLLSENARGKIRINVKNGYIKDNQFVPQKVNAVVFSTDGANGKELYSHPFSKDEMIKDGFSYEEMDCSFHLGDVSGSDNNMITNSDDDTISFVVYAVGPDNYLKQRSEELANKYRQKLDSAQDGHFFQTLKKGINTEYFVMDKVVSEDGETKLYVVHYETCHFLVESFLYFFVSDHPIFDFFLFPLEILLAIILAIVGAIVYIKIRSKHI